MEEKTLDNLLNNISPVRINRDIIAFLLPGAALILLGYYSNHKIFTDIFLKTQFGTIENIIIAIVGSYMIGRITYALTNFILDFISFLIMRSDGYSRKKELKDLWDDITKVNRGKIFTERDRYTYNEVDLLKICYKYPNVDTLYERNVMSYMFINTLLGILIISAIIINNWIWLLVPIFLYKALLNEAAGNNMRNELGALLYKEDQEKEEAKKRDDEKHQDEMHQKNMDRLSK